MYSRDLKTGLVQNSNGMVFEWHTYIDRVPYIYANLVILATPVRDIGHQVVSLGHLGGFVAF